MAAKITQASIEQEITSLLSQKVCSNPTLRMLVVEMILTYLEGTISLSFVLSNSNDLFSHFSSQLDPDLLWAMQTCTSIAEQIRDKKPHSFTEHQKIEDTLVTILQRLHQQDSTIPIHQ